MQKIPASDRTLTPPDFGCMSMTFFILTATDAEHVHNNPLCLTLLMQEVIDLSWGSM